MIAKRVWCDGKVAPAADASVAATDRTLLYGLGAFETVRLHGGRPFLLERHLARMRHTLAALALEEPPTLQGLPSGVPELSRACDMPSALCRITVTAGGAPGAEEARPRVFAMLRDAPPPARRPVVVGRSPFVHDARSPVTGVKSTSYLANYLQWERAEAEGRLDDIMVDAHGEVSEGMVSNVFAVIAGRLVTPPAGEGILPGVTRGVVLELAAERGLDVEQRALGVGELATAEEFFLTGAGKGLVPVDVLLDRELPDQRPLGNALAGSLAARIAHECHVDAASVGF